MCSSDKVDAPASWQDGVLPDAIRRSLENHMQQQSDLLGADTEALRIPLSLSEQRDDLDKHGQACSVFDCVFSKEVMAEAAKLRSMKFFVIETIIGWINHKHHLGVDQRFKLPKLKYKGVTVQAHRIRKDPKKLVTEIEVLDDVDDEPALPLRSVPIPMQKRALFLCFGMPKSSLSCSWVVLEPWGAKLRVRTPGAGLYSV
jgi:hypothetical protein